MTKRQIMRIERRAAELAANETCAARLMITFYEIPGKALDGWFKAALGDEGPHDDEEWAGWLCQVIGRVDEED